jgi:hypothetical protein
MGREAKEKNTFQTCLFLQNTIFLVNFVRIMAKMALFSQNNVTKIGPFETKFPLGSNVNSDHRYLTRPELDSCVAVVLAHTPHPSASKLCHF